MLSAGEVRRWVDRFRVPEAQVRRDHLISHVLYHLPGLIPDTTFFGGTALCRTHLLDWRLSEDLDLLVEETSRAADRLSEDLPEALRREFPGLTVDWGREGETQVGAVSADDVSIRIQLVRFDDSYRRYPVESTRVALRYGDLPEAAEIVCPSATGAAAMKVNAWSDRKAPRDLCDLYGLVQARFLSGEALEIAAQVSRPVQRYDFEDDQLPTQEQWVAALGHQMREPPPRELALASVRQALARLAGWKSGRA